LKNYRFLYLIQRLLSFTLKFQSLFLHILPAAKFLNVLFFYLYFVPTGEHLNLNLSLNLNLNLNLPIRQSIYKGV